MKKEEEEEEENKVKSQKGHVSIKVTENARLPGTELGTDNSQYGVYNNPPLTLNEELLECSE